MTCAMGDRAPIQHSPAAGMTERVDPVACQEERARRQAGSLSPDQSGSYLEVHGTGETQLVALEPGVMHIGRGLVADLRLDENSVSRRHAMLVHDEQGTRVLDDRSSNGTFVNGERVEQAELKHGDVLLLGRVTLRYLVV